MTRWETSEAIAAGLEDGQLTLVDEYRDMHGGEKAPDLGEILPAPSQAPVGVVGFRVMHVTDGTHGWSARAQAIRIVADLRA